MRVSEPFAVACALAVAAYATLSVPEIVQQFASEVQPEIDVIRNSTSQGITPEQLQTLASVISSAAKEADARIKALKGLPIDIVFGVNMSGSNVSGEVKAIVAGAKNSAGEIKASVTKIFASAPSSVHVVARPDVTTLSADISAVVSDVDDLMGDLTQLGGDSGQL